MAKATPLTPRRAAVDPAPGPGLVKKPTRKKKRKKKRFWKNKAREVGEKPGNDAGGVAVRPPKAPEDFSQNWKALQEVRARGPADRAALSPRPGRHGTVRKEPRRGPMGTFLRSEETSSIRSGKLRRRPPPRPQPHPPREEFEVVQKEVADLLKGRILVGHALHNDLKALFLGHPKKKIRDTQKYKPFRSRVKSGRPSLKLLAEKILGIRVQQAEHCSVQDAQAAMRLYVSVRKEWESVARDSRSPASSPALDSLQQL
ncbi:RNA exonuclease 4 isoform X3 [Vicugna pacos]|uniref:RNA exonuclease 4 isoform X3 n=1 Tax=Vicugna pacos TaxID=30538 RepID=A0A6J3AD80_VICPA|nr:RNA exonuclease 4 isoform X2 [Vicugna pacos]